MPKFKMRFRNVYMFIGGALVLLLYLLTDPQNEIIQNIPLGASTVVLLGQLLKTIWFVAMLHASRRALIDYVDLQVLFRKAEQTSEGAAKAVIGVALIMIAVAIVMAAAVLSN